MALGADISASSSNSSSAAGGAASFGNVTLNTGVAGSVGFSAAPVAAILGALIAVWFFFIRKK